MTCPSKRSNVLGRQVLRKITPGMPRAQHNPLVHVELWVATPMDVRETELVTLATVVETSVMVLPWATMQNCMIGLEMFLSQSGWLAQNRRCNGMSVQTMLGVTLIDFARCL